MIENIIPQSQSGLSIPGCPSCDGRGFLLFDWELSRAEPLGELGKYGRTLIRKKQLRLGLLYACPVCGQPWYLDAKMEKMRFVPKERQVLLEDWGSRGLLLPENLLGKARAIGAAPAHRLSVDREFAEVPCKVRTSQGEVFEKCLLTFRTDPPLDPAQEKIRLISDIIEIEPSEFALSLEIRKACAGSVQGRGGRALTYVESRAGKISALNWIVNFVDLKGIAGRDLHLASQEPNNRPGSARVLEEDPSQITFFLGDWDRRLL